MIETKSTSLVILILKDLEGGQSRDLWGGQSSYIFSGGPVKKNTLYISGNTMTNTFHRIFQEMLWKKLFIKKFRQYLGKYLSGSGTPTGGGESSFSTIRASLSFVEESSGFQLQPSQ